jgi:hypothetical protein
VHGETQHACERRSSVARAARAEASSRRWFCKHSRDAARGHCTRDTAGWWGRAAQQTVPSGSRFCRGALRLASTRQLTEEQSAPWRDAPPAMARDDVACSGGSAQLRARGRVTRSRAGRIVVLLFLFLAFGLAAATFRGDPYKVSAHPRYVGYPWLASAAHCA